MAYVYALIDPRDDSWFYVGKGTGRRMRNHFAPSALERETHKTRKIRKLKREGHEPYGRKLLEGVSNELACFVEGELIDKHYDGLTNYCRAGEPRWSDGMPEEIRQKIKERTPSPEGRTMPEEAKRKIAEAQQGALARNAKLSRAEAKQIKWYLECANFRFKKAALAAVYGIAAPTLSAIQSGASWGHVEPQKPEQVSEIVRGSQGQLQKREAAEIKWLAQQSYKARDIAEEYGVGVGVIGPIKHGENFSDVEAQKPERIPDGLEKGWTHLSEKDAAEVKWLGQQGYKHGEVGEEYGVTQVTVSRIARGEGWAGLEPRKPNPVPDHLSPSRKLLKHEAREIKHLALHSGYTQKGIGAKYGISSTVVSRIKREKRWSSVTPKQPD
jgi:uncharacterized protein YerC